MPLPDADIFPHATGSAENIVKGHLGDEELVLYAGWFCPFVQRVWAILEEKKIPYKYVEINPYHKQPEFLALNPRGLVPTLEYKQKALFESTVICEFLEDAYPQHSPRLLPEDAFERARLKIWIDYVTSRMIPSFHRFLQHQKDSSSQSLEEVRQDYTNKLLEFAREMNDQGPFFAGHMPSMVDFIAGPWALRHWVFDRFKDGGLGIPTQGHGGENERTWTRWRQWHAAISQLPSLRDTLSKEENYMPIYQRYHENKAQSELAKATRQGRGVP